MHRVFFGLRRVLHNLRPKFRAKLDSLYLYTTPAAFEVLRILHAYGAYERERDDGFPDGDGGIPRFLIVKLLGIAGPGVSRLLRPLERNGLLRRFRHPQDRRIVIVSLTDYGLGAMNDIDEHFDRWMEAQFRDSLTSSPERADTELDLFERYVWRARYVNADRTPLLDPFTMAEARDLWGGWRRLPPPPPLEFAA